MPAARRRKDARRWLREVQAIVLLVVAGVALVAVIAFDPAQGPSEQAGPVGPVGTWMAWGLFSVFGHAGVLLPILLAAIGLGFFARPLTTRGWLAFAGLGVLLVSATGLLTQSALAIGDACASSAVACWAGRRPQRCVRRWVRWAPG
jgi:hypothetical protein